MTRLQGIWSRLGCQWLLALVLLVEFGGHFALASAAEPGARSGDAEESVGLQEIIVTAEKRSENLQKVPISMTSISADTLKSTGTDGIGALQNLVPNLEILSDSINSEISIRGVDALPPLPASDPVAGFNVDGVAEARPAGANGVFYDINHVEVLRGPQGTLYGRNTTAGVINVVTNRPINTFDALGEIGFGDYRLFHTTGALNLPIGDRVALRAAFQTDKHDGYINRGQPSANADADDAAGRVHVLFTPTDTLSLRLSGDYFQRKGAGNTEVDLSNIRTATDPWSTVYPTNSRGNLFPHVNAKNSGFSGELNWELPAMLVTNIVGRRFVNDEFDGFVAGNESLTVSDSQELTEELRFSSPDHSDIKWVAGAFYSNEHQRAAVSTFDSNGPGSVQSINDDKIRTTSIAGFADVTYPITTTLRALAGIRYTHDSKDANGGVVVTNPATSTSVLPFDASFKSSAANWKLGLESDLRAKSMVYVTAMTGYKAGGFYELPPNLLNGLPNTYKPEKNLAFELGSKNRFLDDRLQVNGDIFYYRYTDFQAQAPGKIFLPNGDSIILLATFNAGAVRDYGVELEVSYQLTEHDRFDISLDYLHDKYVNFLAPGFILANIAVLGTTDLSNVKPPDAPTWASNLAYTHIWPITSSVSLTGHANTHYRGDSNFQAPADPTTFQPAYWNTDAGLSLEGSKRRWYVDALVKNIGNVVVLTNVSTPPFGHIGPPRTFLVNVGARL